MISKSHVIRSQKYLAHVRGHDCLLCRGPSSDAHHLRHAGLRGMGMKVCDSKTIPLCRLCHGRVHQHGDEEKFWIIEGIDALQWANDSYSQWVENNDS